MMRFVRAVLSTAACLLVAAASADPPSAAPADAARTTGGVERGIAYVANGLPDQTLDLYLPEGQGFPTVVFIHGGSLQEVGDRRTTSIYAGVCPPLAAAGIACATIDYRLAPMHKWPDMPSDVVSAVKWIKSNIGARGGDPNRLTLFGHSSGCQLASVVGANAKYLKAQGLDLSDIAGVVAMGCVLAPLEEVTRSHPADELADRWTKSSETSTYASWNDRLDSDASRFIGPNTPPVLVVVAENERFFPSILEQGAKFVRRLLEMQRPANLIIVPGRHVTSIQNFGAPGDPTFDAVKAFVANPSAVAPK